MAYNNINWRTFNTRSNELRGAYMSIDIDKDSSLWFADGLSLSNLKNNIWKGVELDTGFIVGAFAGPGVTLSVATFR